MDKLLTVIANCIFEYGRKGAGIPSQKKKCLRRCRTTMRTKSAKKRKELLRNENRNSFFMVAWLEIFRVEFNRARSFIV